MTDDFIPSPATSAAEEADGPSPAADSDAEPGPKPEAGPVAEATPAVPQQRTPVHDTLSSAPPALPAPRRRRRRGMLAALVIVALGVTAVYPVVTAKPHTGLLGAAPAAAATTTAPPTPYDLAVAVLNGQAAALLRHDHGGWMAAVDPSQPALRKHFEQLYASFQALHVTQFQYHASLGGTKTDPVELNTVMAFCLSATTCPEYHAPTDYSGPPDIAEKLFLKRAGGRYVITKQTNAEYRSDLQPYPWENDTLVFAQGKRVTVAAPHALAGKARTVLSIADKAAVTDDRFAVMMHNPQLRYRVFLADDKAWKSWYGGWNVKYAVAFTVSTGAAGSDVVLHMSQLRMSDLKVIVQHEMAHVATLSNLLSGSDQDMWLKEGVADYIGWLPQHTRQDWDYPYARSALHGSHPPKSIFEAPLKPSASDSAANRFYGLAHFAVECMAAEYGEARAMNFVRMRLRDRNDLDSAARHSFGTSFNAVDKGCLSWMKQHS